MVDDVSVTRWPCVLSVVPWIRAADDYRTVRDVLVNAHTIDGLDPGMNGIQVGAQLRFLTAVAALVIRRQGKPAGSFDLVAVDSVIELLTPSCNLCDPHRPFLQIPAEDNPPIVGKNPVKKLYPWMLADRAESFWSGNVHAAELSAVDAALALAVHHHYSFGGNNRLQGRACVNGSPGIRYPGKDNTATEVLWQGKNLFETLLFNTPQSWVEGEGLPAWADPECAVSHSDPGSPEHPLWRATWGSNTAHGCWENGALMAVSIGGSVHRPPTMGAGKKAAKAWWDLRNTEDNFYLYIDMETKNAKGIVTATSRKAQRLDFGSNETDLAVEWNAKNLSSAMRSRAKATVLTPGRGAQVMFLRHLVEGTASSPVVRRTEVLVSSPKKWAVDVDRALAVSDAALLIKKIGSELCKPFTKNGRLSALRERRPDVEDLFWQRVSCPFEDFIINGAGESIDASVWPLVRAAALEAFDEVTASAPVVKLAPFIMTARNRVAVNISELIGLAKPVAVKTPTA